VCGAEEVCVDEERKRDEEPKRRQDKFDRDHEKNEKPLIHS
jgi:hypothetical protein